MLKGADLAGLTTIFKGEVSEQQEHEKLVDLFRSRAELKKEFAALRNEKYQLQDRIKQQAGATARAEQMLDHVENLLLDPDWVFDVVVFYQLRGLSRRCEVKLADFAEQLKQHQEKRLHGHVISTWNKQRQEKVASIEDAVREQRARMDRLEQELQDEQSRMAEMGAVAKLVHGNSTNKEIDSLGDRLEEARQRKTELLQTLQALKEMDPPDNCGLDTATKRSINIQILAFAQQLYLQYSLDNLLQLAKEATERSVGAVKYGDRSACERILACLDKCRTENWLSESFAEVLKKRCHLLAEVASYRAEDDTVPTSASVSTVFEIDVNGKVNQTSADIIGENFFGIARILSR
jgi:hypothetical protein